MKKIAVFNRKGGVGKTTLAVNIASVMTEYFGKSVLVVDCDSQCNSTDFLIGSQSKESIKDTLFDAFSNPDDFSELNIIHTAKFQKRELVVKKDKSGNILKRAYKLKTVSIDFIPASQDIDWLPIDNISILDNLLKYIEEEYGPYDYCILDCAAYLMPLTLNGMATADYMLVPVCPQTDSFKGLSLIFDTLNRIREKGINLNLKVLGFVLNNVSEQASLKKYLVNLTREQLGNAVVFENQIHSSQAFDDARIECAPINVCSGRNKKVILEMKKVVKEMLVRLEKE